MDKKAVLISLAGSAFMATLLLTAPECLAEKPAHENMEHMEHMDHHHAGHAKEPKKTPQRKKADTLLKKGNALCEAGQFEEALPVYTNAIESDPQFAEAYFKRGMALYRLGSNLNALEDLTKAVQINPDYTEAYFQRGVVWYSTGDEEKMIEDLKTAARLAAVDHTTHEHVLK